ncbi:MAG: hypothetical protein CVV44_19830 [Spirochaetae bacterium HGW-Spirochaetae-1]|jgi:ribonuclease D|nr:MAG: hypothetical protein CVV44_19830 [Spirochaetae bacterium HGW-Spirochaetae-1]
MNRAGIMEQGDNYSANDLPNRITKEFINNLPIIRYAGPISVINRGRDLDNCLSLLSSEELLGFDTETRPTFQRGQNNPVSLIQLATDEIVYIIQLGLTGFRPSLVKLLEDERVKKIGLAVRDDILKLQEIRPFEAAGFIDLSDMASRKGIIQTGLKALAARYLEGRISKAVQTSNWARPDLMEKQKIYAATDAWICLRIYYPLISDERDYHDDIEAPPEPDMVE